MVIQLLVSAMQVAVGWGVNSPRVPTEEHRVTWWKQALWINLCVGLVILQELRLLYIILISFTDLYFQYMILPRKFPHSYLTFKQFHIPAVLTAGIIWHYCNIYSVIFYNLSENLTLFVVPRQLTIILVLQGHLSVLYFVPYPFNIRKPALWFLYSLEMSKFYNSSEFHSDLLVNTQQASYYLLLHFFHTFPTLYSVKNVCHFLFLFLFMLLIYSLSSLYLINPGKWYSWFI